MTISSHIPVGRARASRNRAQTLFEEKYCHHAEYYGDIRPKKDAASAKRMATGAANAAETFAGLLPADDADMLRRAALILRTLGDDLDNVASLSRSAKAKRDRQDLQRRAEVADCKANERWASNDAMREEAVDLADFIDRSDMFKTRVWVQSVRPRCQSAHFIRPIPPGKALLELLQTPVDVATLRRRAAEYVLSLEASQSDPRRCFEGARDIGLDDFVAWREWRGEAESSAIK